jgi:predicted secreted Zn-dependent protease
MKNQPSLYLVAIVGLLLACCVAAGLGTIALFLFSDDIESSLQVAVQPAITETGYQTVTPAPSVTKESTPARKLGTSGSSSTRATATPLSVKRIAYDVFVPTPGAPQVVYAIGFESDLAVETYSVRGTTLNALSASLDANALTDPHEDKSRYYARTDWHLGGNWYWKPTTRGCEVDHGVVTMQMTMTLPVMAEQTGVAATVQTRWNRFVENTVTHESGHVKIALQGARDYQRDLGNFQPAVDCGALKSKLSDLFDHAFSSIDETNVKYDAETKHGVTQGAVFP